MDGQFPTESAQSDVPSIEQPFSARSERVTDRFRAVNRTQINRDGSENPGLSKTTTDNFHLEANERRGKRGVQRCEAAGRSLLGSGVCVLCVEPLLRTCKGRRPCETDIYNNKSASVARRCWRSIIPERSRRRRRPSKCVRVLVIAPVRRLPL